jgi:hypothetical protein
MTKKRQAKATITRGLKYQLEGIPAPVWRAVKTRAAAEGRTVRAVLLALLDEWLARKWMDELYDAIEDQPAKGGRS